MAYVPLPIIEADLHQLKLDLENYRIPTKRKDETAALKYLFTSEDVLGAAKLILRNGYFDNEVPIVVANPGNGNTTYTVLEGNRRVSALKALLDPSAVPGHETEIQALLNRYALESANLPKRIRVLLAESRSSAAPHVARLHTGTSKKRWSLDQQATFYYSLLDEQTTIDDIKAQYPDVAVTRFMRMATMRRFLSSVPFKNHNLRRYAASDELAMSSFEYAYRTKEIAELIGVEFNKDGFISANPTSPESAGKHLPSARMASLEFLLEEFRAGNLNTRSPQFKKNSDSLEGLLDTLRERASLSENEPDQSTTPPQGAAQGAPGQGTRNGSQGDQANTPEKEPEKRGPNRPETKDTLDLSGLAYEKAPINLKNRYIELRSINISKHPVATTVLLRSVLESTIKIHFESTPTPATGELNAAFKTVVAAYNKDKSLRHAINTVQSGNTHKPGSIQWFNLITHSADASTDPKEIHQAWKTVSPLLRRLLLPAR